MKTFITPVIKGKPLVYWGEGLRDSSNIDHIVRLLNYSEALFDSQYTYPEGATKFIDNKDSLEFHTYSVSKYEKNDVESDCHIISLADMMLSRKTIYRDGYTRDKKFKVEYISVNYDECKDRLCLTTEMADDEYYFYNLGILGYKATMYYLSLITKKHNHKEILVE